MKQPFYLFNSLNYKCLKKILTLNTKYVLKALKVPFELKMINIATITKPFSMTDLCNFPYCHLHYQGKC